MHPAGAFPMRASGTILVRASGTILVRASGTTRLLHAAQPLRQCVRPLGGGTRAEANNGIAGAQGALQEGNEIAGAVD